MALMMCAAPLSACKSQDVTQNDVQAEAAERQALINAMEHHPALENQSAATGKPINVPTTVPPKPPGNGHEHHAGPQHPHRH